MKIQIFSFALFLFMLSWSCAPKRDSLNTIQSSPQGSPLPIVGTWTAASYKGFTYSASNERKDIELSDSELRPADWQIESKIDPNGNGFLKTILDCKADTSASRVKQSGIPAPRGIILFPNALGFRECDNGRTVEEHQQIVLTSIRENSLPRNLGLDGRGSSITTECKKLRGLRYIQHLSPFHSRRVGFSGCIGFADADAKKLSLFIIPVGEVRAIHVSLARVK
jgi:hypothetical protein